MERKFDNNIIYKTPVNPFHPPGSFPGTEMFVLDDKTMKGAFPFMCAWFSGPWRDEDTFKPHSHDYEEVIMFIGSDSENPRDLGGEVEFWFENDQYLLKESCLIFVPAMVQHAPMRPTRVNDPKKPILFVGTMPGASKNDMYYYYSRDPKWSKFKDPPPAPFVKWMK